LTARLAAGLIGAGKASAGRNFKKKRDAAYFEKYGWKLKSRAAFHDEPATFGPGLVCWGGRRE
jgi:hypothetical protein